jgi:YVTN family beta-propeller protein
MMMVVIVTMVTLTTSVTYYGVNYSAPASSPATIPKFSSLRGQASNYQVNDSLSCALDGVRSGDVLLAIIQVSGGTGGTNLTASDTSGNKYATYLQDWDYEIGTGGAYANSTSTGADTITVSAGSADSGLALFCYDMTGVVASNTTTSFEALSGNGTTPATNPLTPPQGTFAVAAWGAFGAPVTFSAGPGFVMSETPYSGLDGNYFASEYGIVNSTSTTCRITISVSEAWGGACFLFSPSSSAVVSSSTTSSVSGGLADQIVGNATVGISPGAIAYNPSNNYMYIVNSNDGSQGSVSIFIGKNLVGTVEVGSGFLDTPGTIVYDPSNNDMYVANTFSDSISVISGSLLVANISLGAGPYSLAYDPADGYIYSANYGNGGDLGGSTVSVINGTRLVANVQVMPGPDALVYDSANQYMYVADYSADALTLISGTSTVANITLPGTPYELTYDSSNQYVYSANAQADTNGTVSIVSGTTLVTTLNTGVFPSDPTYDPANNYVYIDAVGPPGPGQNSTIMVISGTAIIANVSVGNDADAMVFNPYNNDIYVASFGTNQVAIISGTGIVGTVNAGNGPDALTYDPVNNCVYVVNTGFAAPGTVYAISSRK